MFDLCTFLSHVVLGLRSKFAMRFGGEFKIIKAYPTNDIEISDSPVPAILVDLYEMVPVSPTSECYSTASLTGRLGLTLMMTAYIVIGASMDKANTKIREYALDVAGWINACRRFNLNDANLFSNLPLPKGLDRWHDLVNLSPAQILSVTNRQEINDDNQSYFVWAVEWCHDVIVGPPRDKEICPDPPVDASQVKKVYADIDVYGDADGDNFKQVYPVTEK